MLMVLHLPYFMPLISIYPGILLFSLLSRHIYICSLCLLFPVIFHNSYAHYANILLIVIECMLDLFVFNIHFVQWHDILLWCILAFHYPLLWSDEDHISLIGSYFEGLFLAFIHSNMFPIFITKGMDNRQQSSLYRLKVFFWLYYL